MGIVGEWKRLWGCATAHSKADIALISGEMKVSLSDLRKLEITPFQVTTVEC
jgi:hypothetical protein